MKIDMTKRKILLDDSQLGPYPLEKLPRVEKITSEVFDNEKRPWQKDHELNRCVRGEYGEAVRKSATLLPSHNPMCEALYATIPHISYFPENPVAAEKAPLPEDLAVLSRHVKKYTYFIGADQVGICKVPPRTVYHDCADGTPFESDYKYAIVFLLRKDPDSVAATHGDEWVDDPASWAVYQRLAVISVTLARYIRNLGYPARASCNGNYVTLMPQLIAEAGLGEFSRMGIVVNPFYGASHKAACVLCDLPLQPDQPIDFGLQDYCSRCTICAEQCPSGAIPFGEKVEYNGYKSWILNKKKCAIHCVTIGHGDICQRCTKVCPFNRPSGSPKDFEGWDGNLEYLYQLVEAQKQHMIEHDFLEPAESTGKWWLPIREKDGEMQIMPEYDYAMHYKRMEALKQKEPK